MSLKRLYAKVADELERVGFKPNSSRRYDFTGRGLLARIVEVSDENLRVDFAQKSTFDRWANSTNFVVYIDPDSSAPDLEKAAKHARKICASKVFDFQTYFHPIDLS
jgi:hypothetical protein